MYCRLSGVAKKMIASRVRHQYFFNRHYFIIEYDSYSFHPSIFYSVANMQIFIICIRSFQ